MFINELQNEIPELVSIARELAKDLECAESCDSKADFCESLRSAITKLTIAKHELTSLLKQAEKAPRFCK